MRHVDHAHHPEGDGQTGSGEQQHRAERDAVEHALQNAPELLDARQRGRGGGDGGGDGLGLIVQRLQQGFCLDIAPQPQNGHRRDALGIAATIAREQRGGLGLLHGAFGPGIFLGGNRPRQQRQGGGVVRGEDFLGCFLAGVGIGGEQIQPAFGGLDGAADGVVHPHGINIVLIDIAGLLAGAGVEIGIALFDQNQRRAIAGGIDVKIVGLDGGNGGSGLRMAGHGKCADRIGHDVEILRGKPDERIGSVVGAGWAGCEQWQAYQQHGEKAVDRDHHIPFGITAPAHTPSLRVKRSNPSSHMLSLGFRWIASSLRSSQ